MQLASTVMLILVSGKKYVTPSLVPEKNALTSICATQGVASAMMNAVMIFFILSVGVVLQKHKISNLSRR